MRLLSHVVAINYRSGVAVFEGGAVFRFSVLLDEDGDETTDIDEAVIGICRTPCGRWAVVDFSQFEEAVVH